MLEAFRFFMTATRGHRLRPWRSEYLKWRLETYTGKHAEEIGPRDFWHLIRTEHRQLLSFLRWISDMKTYTAPDSK